MNFSKARHHVDRIAIARIPLFQLGIGVFWADMRHVMLVVYSGLARVLFLAKPEF